MAVAISLDGNTTESPVFTGAEITRRYREKDHATLQFNGAGSYSFVFEGRATADMPFSTIGTYTQDDESKITMVLFSVGTQYRFRRTAGAVDVAIQG